MELDELAKGRDRVGAAACALDLGRARLVAEDEQVRDAAVVEPEPPEPEPALAPDAWSEGPVGVVAPVVEAGVWAGVCG